MLNWAKNSTLPRLRPGEESLFLVNFSTTQTALTLYTARSGGDDVINTAEIVILGIVRIMMARD
ncbi:hypothetical protein [Nitrosomonas ureae]|uniref:hypothetical protein n=1 Tax=Nitrosomonas ureae TaxID=44577 RepID=UPI0011B27B54|nr:hypothetical protein [Nitrosomonas ureae]